MNLADTLLSPYQLTYELTLKNRIIMAPLTRNKADNDLNPTQAMADYYAKRADAGLIISEATVIRPDAKSYSNVPGIYTTAQIDGWKRITDKVHANGGKMFSQLWHVGRVNHPSFINGELPISASETIMQDRVKRSEDLFYGKSRAATLIEIKELIANYATAAQNAMKAGFDGVEIHGANGYLIDQFLHYHTNHRTDEYGGSPENMAQFALEIVKACGEAIGYHRVGIRLSPAGYLNELVADKRDAVVFQYFLEQLNNLPIAYVHTGNFDDGVKFEALHNKTMTEFMRAFYKGNLIACGGYTFEKAAADIGNHNFDLVAIGRPFIANPDLISRFKNKLQIQEYSVAMLETLV